MTCEANGEERWAVRSAAKGRSARIVRRMLSAMKTKPPRHTKLRQATISGGGPLEVFSTSRPTKPPAKAIHARKAAALRTGGKHLPPKVRQALEREGLPKRTRPAENGAGGGGLRAGKRVPRRGKKPNPGT